MVAAGLLCVFLPACATVVAPPTATPISQAPPAQHLQRGIQLADAGSHRAAVSEFTAAIQLGLNTAELHLHRANSQAFLGNVDEALDDYAQALALQPDLAVAYNNRAALLYTIGRMREAWQDIESCRGLGATPHADLVGLIEEGLDSGRTPPPLSNP